VLSFEMVKVGDSDALQVWCDDAGMNILIKKLEAVRKLGPTHHIHLYAGQDLDLETPFKTPAIAEVIIDFDRPPE
jgi:hypothetical protein